jgi:hypothetical protein
LKSFLYAIGMVMAFALPASAWAQQQDLEVTIRMVPADAAADAATKVIQLPATASPQGQESSAFGIGIANKAREMRGEHGREFGQEVSAAARERAQARGAPAKGPGKP